MRLNAEGLPEATSMDRQVSSGSECDTGVDRFVFRNASLMRVDASPHILGAQAIGRLDFLQWLAPGSTAGLVL